MVTPNPSMPEDEVDQLLLNARLRDELEPYLDESVQMVNVRNMPTRDENEFLASMLEWERAPVLPICQWFQPKLTPPPADSLGDHQLHAVLWETIHALFAKHIVLDFSILILNQVGVLHRKDIACGPLGRRSIVHCEADRLGA